MIEVIAAIARWSQLSANLILLGSCVFLAITSTEKQAYVELWIKRLERLFLWLALGIPLGLFIILCTNIVQVTGNNNALLQTETWLSFLSDTQAGQIWIWRVVLAVLLLLSVIYLCKSPRARWRYIFCAFIAALPLIASSFSSHIAAEEVSATAILLYAMHLIFAGIWFGALPAFLLLIYANNSEKNGLALSTMKRFSSIALPVMLLIILTGIIIGDSILGNYYAALVATPYGWLLSTKIFLLGIILLIALRVRSSWLPLLTSKNQTLENESIMGAMRKWVRIEFALAAVLVLLATLITNTTPVKDALIENWPFPFRFSIISTWNQPNVAIQVWIGLIILIFSIATFKLGQSRNWGIGPLISIPAILFVCSLIVALPPLAIQAYPETYRKPLVPFDTVSVANGAELYEKHCVECHGYQGKGNGIKSRTLSTKLPDLLIEPHTAEHKPGDFYNWITYGINNTDMPGYREKLSEEDRWDLVNFIHALSRGYQARILTPEIIQNKAFVKPPGFSYFSHDGNSGALQDFRENRVVLLVIFTWPQSQHRIEQLKVAYNLLSQQGAEILLVPSRNLTANELAQLATLPFPLITDNAAEITNSYSLWRRTLSHPDIIGRGTNPDHMEFLLDRHGYLRARWIPSIDQASWSDISRLSQQIRSLNNERETPPPPEDYVE